jgi:hypothetical protein
MRVFRDAYAIFRIEMTLFQRFPKLKISAIGVIIIATPVRARAN